MESPPQRWTNLCQGVFAFVPVYTIQFADLTGKLTATPASPPNVPRWALDAGGNVPVGTRDWLLLNPWLVVHVLARDLELEFVDLMAKLTGTPVLRNVRRLMLNARANVPVYEQ